MVFCIVICEVFVMNGYITVQEAALKWGISPRQVQILCKSNRIDGATRMSRIWIIPENAEKPSDARVKTGKYIGIHAAEKESN